MAQKKKTKRIRGEAVLALAILPSAAGVFVFYIAPFFVSIYNALIDNPVSRRFVGFQNFADVLLGGSFKLAMTNTAIFTALCIPLNMVIPLLLALALNRAKWLKNAFWLVFLLPLVIPAGSMLFVWRKTFGLSGWINALFFADNPINWLYTPFVRGIVLFIFIWKNAGYNMVLFYAGLTTIPKTYYECAAIEGAGPWRQFRTVTLVYLTPTAFLAFMMAFINSFKVFKEVYLLAGRYPHESVYMLQHFLYNQFSGANYQKLAASSYIVTIAFVLFTMLLFTAQRKISENF